MFLPIHFQCRLLQNCCMWERVNLEYYSFYKKKHFSRCVSFLLQTNCSLHLTQKFDKLYYASRSSSILSRASAPGLLIATGNVGNHIHIDKDVGIYVSSNAGYNWHQVWKRETLEEN